MAEIRTVFLSSTGRDLGDYRRAAEGAINALPDYKCVRMEDFGARAWQADEFCRGEVSRCEIFVGIIGTFFGDSPKGSEQSYTQREYEAARAHHKPCLMFLTAEDFPMPANLRESDDKWERQQRFRQSINGDLIRGTFRSPGELAPGIIQALTNLEREGRFAPAQPPFATYPAAEKEAHTGPLVAGSCDRAEQERAFRESMQQQARFRSFLIHGSAGQCHESLSRRFCYYLKSEKATVFEKEFRQWWEPAERMVEEVLRAAHQEPGEDPAAQLTEWLRESQYAAYVLRHNIDLGEFDSFRPRLEAAESYLRLWAKAARGAKDVHLFLNVIYPYPAGALVGRLRTWYRLRPVRRDLNRLARGVSLPGAACTLLPELGPVHRDHLLACLRKNLLLSDEEARIQAALRFFGEKRKRRMSEIEAYLRTLAPQA